MSECKYCHQPIEWEHIDGKNIALNPDGTKHTPTCPALNKDKGGQVRQGHGVPKTSTTTRKEGVLLSQQGNGVLIRMENGDRTYAIDRTIALPEGEVLPQKIEFAVNDRNFIIDYKLMGLPEKPPVKTGKEILQEDKKAAHILIDGVGIPPVFPGNIVPDSAFDVIAKEIRKTEAASTSSSQPRMWSGETTLSIGVTINLENYESLKITVTGAAADRAQLTEYLNETLEGFGKTDATREMIRNYQRRVLG